MNMYDNVDIVVVFSSGIVLGLTLAVNLYTGISYLLERKQPKQLNTKTAKWERVLHETVEGDTFEAKNRACSSCGHSAKYQFPYCPWCGSKMESEK